MHRKSRNKRTHPNVRQTVIIGPLRHRSVITDRINFLLGLTQNPRVINQPAKLGPDLKQHDEQEGIHSRHYPRRDSKADLTERLAFNSIVQKKNWKDTEPQMM